MVGNACETVNPETDGMGRLSGLPLSWESILGCLFFTSRMIAQDGCQWQNFVVRIVHQTLHPSQPFLRQS